MRTKYIIICLIAIFLSWLLGTLASCGIHPAIKQARERQQAIQEPVIFAPVSDDCNINLDCINTIIIGPGSF